MYTIGYSLIIGDLSSLNKLVYLLSEREEKEYNDFKFEKRKISYILGRISAKLAISDLLPNIQFNSISIGHGVFGFPVVAGLSENIQVSISHSSNLGVALAFPEEHPVGIDIEEIDHKKTTLIKRFVTLDGHDYFPDITETEGVFMYWSAMEALSKILNTGLTLDFKFLALKEFRPLTNDLWECHFKNFSQYKGILFKTDTHVCSVVIPAKSDIELNYMMRFKDNLIDVLSSINTKFL
ncbi:4'-phosphopantetheinyl transferase family protein [Chryseobacterium antibioticum]|nr:4'-phosphopantetheinyl transferase superfamily protein [Chryseobacterium antibioticum]